MPIRDVKPSEVFVGRQGQLEWMERILYSRERFHDPFFVVGAAGVGKTALIAEFLRRNDREVQPLWIASSDGRQLSIDLEEAHDQLLRAEGRRRREVIVVLTDFAAGDDRLVEETIRRVFNYKIVRGLLIEGRTPPSSDRYPVLTLQPLAEREARELLYKQLTVELPPETIDQMIARSGGYPLLVQMMAGAVKVGGIESVPDLFTGQLYKLTDEIPRGKVVSVVKPQLIVVKNDLIDKLQKQPKSVYDLTPRKFEELLAELLEDQGGEVELTQETRDGGRDILAHFDTPVGKILCLVDAKRYREDRTVGVGLVRQLHGTLVDHKATNAMMVTTSKYSPDARAYQQRHKYHLSLKDYADVVAWIQSYKQRSKSGLILPS